MIPIPLLHSTAVKKTKKKLHLDLEKRPFCSFFTIYIGRQYYMWLVLSNPSISGLVPRRKVSPKIAVPWSKRGKCAPAGGHSPVLNQKKYKFSGKWSKIRKTEKMRKLLMKFFFLFSPARSTNMSKWSLWSLYLSRPSRKGPRSYNLTSKMDQEKAFFSPIYMGPLAG